MISSFVHLHIHSNYTLCKGASCIDDLCAAAAAQGATHLALTDTNGVYGLRWFLESARTYGLVPLIGADLQTDQTRAVVLVRSMTGYARLCRAISLLHREPTFSLSDYLQQSGAGLVVISHDPVLLRQLHHQTEADLYAEVIPYHNREQILRLARQLNIPPVASNAVYFVRPEDECIHRLLRAIDLNTTLDHLDNEECVSPRAFLASAQHMIDAFPDAPDAIENTQTIAFDCTLSFKFDSFIFASVQGANGEDAQDLLAREVQQGVRWRYRRTTSAIRNRLDYELKLIGDKGFAPYFLVVADIVRKAPRTCGRGSAAASLVSYALGITHVDPLRYDLFFDRFLNPGRVDPPDIDVDFPWDERDDVLDDIFQTYGVDGTAMIANHNTFKTRAAVREVAKVYGLPEGEISRVTRRITGYGQPNRIFALVQTHPVFRGIELDAPWPDIFRQAESIRGFPRHLSVHCGGVVIAPDGLDRYVPVQPAKKVLLTTSVRTGTQDAPEPVRVVQWEKDQSEAMGLIKIDILGNRSLAVIRDTLEAIREYHGVVIDYSNWHPEDDPQTRSMMAKGDTIGVFYVESPAMRQLMKKAGTGDFEHLVIHSSIIRPAANEYINEYVRRLKGGTFEYLHPRLESILKESYGIMVYQEDVSRVAMALAGFDSTMADQLRKIISKKNKQKTLEEYRQKFYAGARENSVETDVCDAVWKMIVSFAGYSFCKPHSASYALVSFKSAFLRAHYPEEFMAAVLSNQGGYYSPFAYLSEARRMGINILLPDINQSRIHYVGHHKTIRIGLMQIKGLGENAMKQVIADRERRGPFSSFDAFCQRVSLDPSDTERLIMAGCFDEVECSKSRPRLIWQLHLSQNRYQKRVATTLSLFDEPEVSPDIPDYEGTTVLQQEIDTLGFLISRHPLTLYSDRLKHHNVIAARELNRYVDRRVHVLGWLITRKAVSTSKQDLMEFLSFEDTTAIYETVFFPKVYSRFIHMIRYHHPYILGGVVRSEYGAVTLHVDQIDSLAEPVPSLQNRQRSPGRRVPRTV